MKRAQILVADLWACFGGKGHGHFLDIQTVTMFADYRVPQALLAIGALEYSEELMTYLRDGPATLSSGDEREVEIRGCSIWAVELLRKIIAAEEESAADAVGGECDEDQCDAGAAYNAIVIDFFLWDYAKAHATELAQFPVHKTRSVFY